MLVVRWLRRVYANYVQDLREKTNAEASSGPEADRQMVVVVLTVLASLILIRFFGSSGRLSYWTDLLSAVGLRDWGEALQQTLLSGEHQRIARKVFWAGARVVGYVLIPAAIVRLTLPHLSLAQLFGLSLKEPFKHVRAYLVMLAVIAPCVVAASFLPSFQHKYPYYALKPGESVWPWFLAWEVLYALQFVALEIFYRGFMVHGLKPRLGHASILFMMVPYMMIHFGKPLPECVGSIIAGFVLGTMSLKSGAIWGGAALHVIVAWSMDALSLMHQRGW